MDGEFRKRCAELAIRAGRSGRCTFTRFMDPAMESDALFAASRQGVNARFFGGYPEAERRICAFAEGEPEEEFPIACILIRWNGKFADINHRDILGSVMGLGLERDATGDICIGAEPGTACLFAHADVADYIRGNLESVGNARVKCGIVPEVPELAPPQGEEIRVTVQSERLDGVIAAGYRLSRGEAQRLIAQGLTKHNHVEERRGDVRVGEGDVISLRGYGRLRVENIDGTTRRGRIAMRLFRYKR